MMKKSYSDSTKKKLLILVLAMLCLPGDLFNTGIEDTLNFNERILSNSLWKVHCKLGCTVRLLFSSQVYPVGQA